MLQVGVKKPAAGPRAQGPRKATASAVLVGLALALTAACSRPALEDAVLRTHLYALETKTYALEPFVGLGGAIDILGDDLLIATPQGRFALMAPDGTFRYLDGQVPMGRPGVDIPSDRARVADILLKEHSLGRFELFVSHHYFTGPPDECFLFRLSSTTLHRNGQDVALSGTWRTVFDARPCFRPGFAGHEAGGRLLTDGPNHLLVLVGHHGATDEELLDDEGELGQLRRIDIRTGAAETLTRGHRNPQGLARDAAGDLWAAEHGPRGGDELNLLESGRHYGYPHVSYGLPYVEWPDREYGSEGRHDGFTRPAFAWVPSPGISALVVNERRAFPLWDDDLLIASLGGTSHIKGVPGGHSIFRVRRRGRVIQYVERILVDGAIRDMAFLQDGLALLLDSGRIELMRPLAEERAAMLSCAASRLFALHCAECHSLNEKTHRAGPHLVGVLGRRAGAVQGFAGFSDALQSLDRIWTPRDMERYIVAPERFAPGTVMRRSELSAREARQIVGLIGGGPDAVEGLHVGTEEDGYSGKGPILAHRFRSVTAGLKYALQLRMLAANGDEAYSDVVTAVPDRYGTFVLRWSAPAPEVCATHEFRLRADGETEWRPWRRLVPRVE